MNAETVYAQELKAIHDEIYAQELKAICDEIRSYGIKQVECIEKHYNTNLENIKLRYLLTHLRNFRESFKAN